MFCFIYFFWPLRHVRSYFPDEGSNLYTLHWKPRIVTAGPPGKSSSFSSVLFPNPPLPLIYLKSWADTSVSETRDVGGGFWELGKQGSVTSPFRLTVCRHKLWGWSLIPPQRRLRQWEGSRSDVFGERTGFRTSLYSWVAFLYNWLRQRGQIQISVGHCRDSLCGVILSGFLIQPPHMTVGIDLWRLSFL